MVTEHSVQLDANFEKYGYSAHLRTTPLLSLELTLNANYHTQELSGTGV